MEWDRKAQGTALLLAAVLIFACGIRFAQWQGERHRVESQVKAPDQKTPGTKGRLCIHLAGAVAKPGVYYFDQGTRLCAAVEKAAALPEADLDALNLAKELTDGEKIVVPRKGEAQGNPPPGTGAVVRQAEQSGQALRAKVNLNTATAAELDQLPGIGPTYAQRIIDYRTSHGQFRSVEDLKNVSGIGEKRFQQLKELVIVQ